MRLRRQMAISALALAMRLPHSPFFGADPSDSTACGSSAADHDGSLRSIGDACFSWIAA